MTTMTISPMQREYVTRKEFDGLKTHVDEGFDMTNKHIYNLEKHMDNKFINLETKMDGKFAGLKTLMMEGFGKMEEYVDNSNKETAQKVTEKITAHIDLVKTEIINQINYKK